MQADFAKKKKAHILGLLKKELYQKYWLADWAIN